MSDKTIKAINNLSDMAHGSLHPKMDNSHNIDAHKMIKILRELNGEITKIEKESSDIGVKVRLVLNGFVGNGLSPNIRDQILKRLEEAGLPDSIKWHDKIMRLEKLNQKRSDCRDYLMQVEPNRFSVQDALDFLGYGRNGLNFDD